MTYCLGPSKEHAGVDFFEVLFTSNQKFGIPSDRAATFQDELRTLHQAAAIVPSRDAENLYIQQKMCEAYGADATVHIKRVNGDAIHDETSRQIQSARENCEFIASAANAASEAIQLSLHELGALLDQP